MKKLKTIVVSLCLVLTLGGCGKSEETYTAEELANMSEKELAEIMEQQEKKDKKDKADKKNKADEPCQEIIDAEWYSGKVQIDGIIIDLPVTASELVELGFEYHSPKGLGLADDYLYGCGEIIYITFSLDDKDVFTCYPVITLEGFHTFEEIITEQNPLITSISSSASTADQAPIIYHPGGLKVGDSFAQIEERLGAPTEIDSDMTHHYGNDRVYFVPAQNRIVVDRNTQKIISIQTDARINPVALNIEHLETLSVDDYVCHDNTTHTFNMKMFPNAEYDAKESQIKAAFVLDEQVYSFVIYMGISNSLRDNYTTYIINETDDAGVTRTLDEFYEFSVSKNGYHMTGRITIDNVSNPDANNAYGNEEFTNAIYEIIRSIQLD